MKPYKYYNGEKENPHDGYKATNKYNFWSIEAKFEEGWKAGVFDAKSPLVMEGADWKAALTRDKPDKEELFKLWIQTALTDTLPDKYQTEHDHYLKLYFSDDPDK